MGAPTPVHQKGGQGSLPVSPTKVTEVTGASKGPDPQGGACRDGRSWGAGRALPWGLGASTALPTLRFWPAGLQHRGGRCLPWGRGNCWGGAPQMGARGAVGLCTLENRPHHAGAPKPGESLRVGESWCPHWGRGVRREPGLCGMGAGAGLRATCPGQGGATDPGRRPGGTTTAHGWPGWAVLDAARHSATPAGHKHTIHGDAM